jgi:hypothetical protein
MLSIYTSWLFSISPLAYFLISFQLVIYTFLSKTPIHIGVDSSLTGEVTNNGDKTLSEMTSVIFADGQQEICNSYAPR